MIRIRTFDIMSPKKWNVRFLILIPLRLLLHTNMKIRITNFLCNYKQIIRYKYDTKVYKCLFIVLQTNKKVEFETSFIILHYDIFSYKIKCQNIIISDLKFSFITTKCDNYVKHVNLQ